MITYTANPLQSKLKQLYFHIGSLTSKKSRIYVNFGGKKQSGKDFSVRIEFRATIMNWILAINHDFLNVFLNLSQTGERPYAEANRGNVCVRPRACMRGNTDSERVLKGSVVWRGSMQFQRGNSRPADKMVRSVWWLSPSLQCQAYGVSHVLVFSDMDYRSVWLSIRMSCELMFPPHTPPADN